MSLLAHIADAEEFLSAPYTSLISQLQIYATLPTEVDGPRPTLSQKAQALRHAELYVHKGDIFDCTMRVTVKSGGVFLKLANGRGWVAEQTPLGQKIASPATVTASTDLFRVLAESLRIRKSASRSDVALSTRVTKMDAASGERTLEFAFGDIFESCGVATVRGDQYVRLKDGRGYVLSMDASIPLVMRVEPQVGTWMYRVEFSGGIGARHAASLGDQHRVAPSSDRANTANIPCGTAIECDMRVLKRVGTEVIAFARLSDGGGWVFDSKRDLKLLELIAWDYSGPADEEVVAALSAVDDACRPPPPREEVEKGPPLAAAASAEGHTEAAPEPRAVAAPSQSAPALGAEPSLASAVQRAALAPRAQSESNMLLSPGKDEGAVLELVKTSSANLHAASKYSSVEDSDQVNVVEALSTLNRIWPTSLSA